MNLDPAYLAVEGYANEWQDAENGCSGWTVFKDGAEGVAGVAATGAVAVGGTAAIDSGGYFNGNEISVGDDFRVSPFGNRDASNPFARRPHYHRTITGPNGETVPGGSGKWHRTLGEGVVMDRLLSPFVANDRGDVMAFDLLETMYADIEAIDASKMELFDATGRPLRAVVEGYKWHVDEQRTGEPAPERLGEILRDYFSRLPDELAEFSTRAAAASSLEELLQLRIELSAAPDTGRWSKLFRRSWG